MSWSSQGWVDQVQAAAEAFDQVRLRELYEIGRRELGPRFEEEWIRALSGFDATAITG